MVGYDRRVKAAIAVGSTILATEASRQAMRQARKGLNYASDEAVKGVYSRVVSEPSKKKKRMKRKSNARLTGDVAACKEALALLKEQANASLGSLRYIRHFNAQQLTSNVNLMNTQGHIGMNMTNLTESIQNVRLFNPAAPGTPLTVDLSSGTYQRELFFRKAGAILTIRNNFQSDCDVTVYLCRPKEDTSISPTSAMSNGFVDQVINGPAPSHNQIGTLPTDYQQFNDLWRAKVMLKSCLKAGETLKASHWVKPFQFDPSILDSQTDIYQPDYQNFVFLVLVNGTLMHNVDVPTTVVGRGLAGVDIEVKRDFRIEYDAGANFKSVYFDNSFGAVTSSAVQTHEPIPDNVAYSIL